MGVFFPKLQQKSPTAEAFRLLRINLDFLVSKKGLNSILITSTGKGSEGKSTISLNLAYSMAEMDKRVILVDADFRKPRLHSLLKIDTSPGVIDILQGKVTIEEGIQYADDDQRIGVIPCGQKSGSIPLINKFSFQKFLEECKSDRDLVIVDSAPLFISDSLNLAAVVDGVVLVVSLGETNRRDYKEGLKLLNNVEANVLGVVVNKITKKEKSYYYSYY